MVVELGLFYSFLQGGGEAMGVSGPNFDHIFQFECPVITNFILGRTWIQSQKILFSLKNHWEFNVRVWSFKLLLLEVPEALHCQFIVIIQLSLDHWSLFEPVCPKQSKIFPTPSSGVEEKAGLLVRIFLLADHVDTQLTLACRIL